MIQLIAEAASTNADVVRALAGEGWPEGQWLVAARQNAGRGRLGREWHDGAGNFMGSTAVALRAGDPPAPTLALVAGLAVAAAVNAYLAPPARALLKWPNDVLVGDAKLAGILLERVGDAVVVGIGVNLAHAPAVAGRRTAALTDFATAPALSEFATTLAAELAGQVAAWRQHGLAATIARWQQAAHPLGTMLSVGEGEAAIRGSFAGLDASGALRLRLADGTVHTFHAGEVHIV